MSLRNAINGKTTTVIPPGSAHAGNMNNMLLPAPVGITTTIRLSPELIALIAGFCTLRNWASGPINRCNCSCGSACIKRILRSVCSSAASSSNGHRLRLPRSLPVFSCFTSSALTAFHADSNPKNRCQSELAVQYRSLMLATSPDLSNNDLA